MVDIVFCYQYFLHNTILYLTFQNLLGSHNQPKKWMKNWLFIKVMLDRTEKHRNNSRWCDCNSSVVWICERRGATMQEINKVSRLVSVPATAGGNIIVTNGQMQAATIGIIKTIFLKKIMRNTFATNHKTVIKLGCICTCSNNYHYVIVCVLQTDCSYNLCSTEHMQYKSNKRWCNHNHCSNETIWSRKILLRVWQLKSCNYLKGYFNSLLRDKILKAVKSNQVQH